MLDLALSVELLIDVDEQKPANPITVTHGQFICSKSWLRLCEVIRLHAHCLVPSSPWLMCTLGTTPDFIFVNLGLVEGRKVLWSHACNVPELFTERARYARSPHRTAMLAGGA